MRKNYKELYELEVVAHRQTATELNQLYTFLKLLEGNETKTISIFNSTFEIKKIK